MIQKLSPELFTRELYQVNNSLMCDVKLKDLYLWGYIVGYCDASRIKGLQSRDEYGVMFEVIDNDEYMLETYVEDRPNNRFWFHWPKNTFDKLIKQIEEELSKIEENIINGENNGITPKGIL